MLKLKEFVSDFGATDLISYDRDLERVGNGGEATGGTGVMDFES